MADDSGKQFRILYMHNDTLLQNANVVPPQLNCCVLLCFYRNFKEHGEDKI